MDDEEDADGPERGAGGATQALDCPLEVVASTLPRVDETALIDGQRRGGQPAEQVADDEGRRRDGEAERRGAEVAVGAGGGRVLGVEDANDAADDDEAEDGEGQVATEEPAVVEERGADGEQAGHRHRLGVGQPVSRGRRRLRRPTPSKEQSGERRASTDDGDDGAGGHVRRADGAEDVPLGEIEEGTARDGAILEATGVEVAEAPVADASLVPVEGAGTETDDAGGEGEEGDGDDGEDDAVDGDGPRSGTV